MVSVHSPPTPKPPLPPIYRIVENFSQQAPIIFEIGMAVHDSVHAAMSFIHSFIHRNL